MATEIIELDVRSDPATIHVREDVQSVLVVVCAAGRPVGLRHFARPTDGTLATRDLLASYRACLETTVLPDSHAERLTAAPLSVIVCTHERPDDLARCLEALAAITREGDETIVAIAALLFMAVLVLQPTSARAQTWTGLGTDYNTAANWTPNTVPATAANTATFSGTNVSGTATLTGATNGNWTCR